MKPEWACALRDKCVSTGVPFFFKQWGAHNERLGRAGRVLEGQVWGEMSPAGSPPPSASRCTASSSEAWRSVGLNVDGAKDRPHATRPALSSVARLTPGRPLRPLRRRESQWALRGAQTTNAEGPQARCPTEVGRWLRPFSARAGEVDHRCGIGERAGSQRGLRTPRQDHPSFHSGTTGRSQKARTDGLALRHPQPLNQDRLSMRLARVVRPIEERRSLDTNVLPRNPGVSKTMSGEGLPSPANHRRSTTQTRLTRRR